MTCSKCHTENPEGFAFCSSCGAALTPPPSPDAVTQLDPGLGSTHWSYATGKQPTLAAALAIIPTAGQLYNGDFRKAGGLWIVIVFCILAASTFIGLFVAIPLAVYSYGWSILDAYRVAKREKKRW